MVVLVIGICKRGIAMLQLAWRCVAYSILQRLLGCLVRYNTNRDQRLPRKTYVPVWTPGLSITTRVLFYRTMSQQVRAVNVVLTVNKTPCSTQKSNPANSITKLRKRTRRYVTHISLSTSMPLYPAYQDCFLNRLQSLNL